MKNVLITGASSGIGLEINNVLKDEYNTFLTGRRIIDKPNYYACNLADLRAPRELYNKACEYFQGSIDILINCAGQYIYKPIEQMHHQEIDDLININFKAAYELSALIIPDMKKKLWGRIINIGSISGMVGEGNATLYSATKAALSGFTKSLALEVAKDNITINQINPGWVDTPLTNNALSEDEKQEVLDVTPQKRFVTSNEVAKMVAYLISDDARSMTGQNINLCAGLSIGS